MSIKRTRAADVRPGRRDLLRESDFESSNIGHRISIVIPEDVLMRIREMARKSGMRYQTLMNRILREAAFPDSGASIGERVARLEKAVFRRKIG